MTLFIRGLLFSFFILIFFSCEEPRGSACPVDKSYEKLQNAIGQINNYSPVFPNTQKINLDPYSYTRNGVTYTINYQRGTASPPIYDVCSFFENVALHSTNPRFIIPVVNSNLVAICISKSLLQLRVNKSSIENTDEILWTWNSGLKTGIVSGGNLVIDFEDGRMVKKGIIEDNNNLIHLSPGVLYFFSMWAWNDEGTKVIHSSPIIPFMVSSRLFSFSSLAHLGSGKWTVVSAIETSTGNSIISSIVPNTFTTVYRECKSDIDQMTAEEFWYLENNVRKVINYSKNKIFIRNSDIFKQPLDILFSCDKKIILRTSINNQEAILTYVK